jgi:hypothetical protein
MRMLRELARNLIIFLFGANSVLIYLKWTMPALPAQAAWLHSVIMPCFWVLFCLFLIVDRKDNQAGLRKKEISPAVSGAAVILLTGVAVVFALGWHAKTAPDFVFPAVVAGLTILITLFVFRFASRNPEQIGEARFKSPAAPPNP